MLPFCVTTTTTYNVRRWRIKHSAVRSLFVHLAGYSSWWLCEPRHRYSGLPGLIPGHLQQWRLDSRHVKVHATPPATAFTTPAPCYLPRHCVEYSLITIKL